MKNLLELLACYDPLDGYLDSEWRAGGPAKREKIEKRQKINDHAYFLLCWGRLEAHLDEACRDAIKKRWKNPDWTKRRGWDLYNPDDKRISGLKFDERISLVLDRQSAGGEWSMTMKWYNLRNFIAHGGSHDERIDLAFAVNEFHQVQSCVGA